LPAWMSCASCDAVSDKVTSLLGDRFLIAALALLFLLAVGILTVARILWVCLKYLVSCVIGFLEPWPPAVEVELTAIEATNVLEAQTKFDPKRIEGEDKEVHLWDPATLDYFGSIPVMTQKDVEASVARARVAQAKWAQSSFRTRRLLMRTLLRFATEHQEDIARVAVRESGKTVLDAVIGEILVTCEKLKWLTARGEQCLLPERREPGTLMMMKRVHVEWVPLGVVGAIVPWNYPYHNVLNPVSAALFAGNAIVLKVSEHASWSIGYYGRMIGACLDAVGAPRDLVQFVVGYGSTGASLVSSGVDKIIFVGSPAVGRAVARAAADTLTPVVLELGGKDAFVVCDDADIPSIVQIACRGVWQNNGQNCAGPERFMVYDAVFDEFCDGVVRIVRQMQCGSPLSSSLVDCGAITAGPNQVKRFQVLVDDAVKRGARLLIGGEIPIEGELANGCFYPPTVLADVPEDALIAREEIFGPIMCIIRVKGNSDDEAVRLANASDFGLSSCAFSASAARAASVAGRLRAGMSAVNDLEGTTYMSQSLPFGGCKQSGYGRFSGAEGLRDLSLMRSVCQDRFPFKFLRSSIPPAMQYPATGFGHSFAMGLISLVYSQTVSGRFRGLIDLIRCLMAKPKRD